MLSIRHTSFSSGTHLPLPRQAGHGSRVDLFTQQSHSRAREWPQDQVRLQSQAVKPVKRAREAVHLGAQSLQPELLSFDGGIPPLHENKGGISKMLKLLPWLTTQGPVVKVGTPLMHLSTDFPPASEHTRTLTDTHRQTHHTHSQYTHRCAYQIFLVLILLPLCFLRMLRKIASPP